MPVIPMAACHERWVHCSGDQEIIKGEAAFVCRIKLVNHGVDDELCLGDGRLKTFPPDCEEAVDHLRTLAPQAGP